MEGDTLVRKYYSEHECLNDYFATCETSNTILKADSQIIATFR